MSVESQDVEEKITRGARYYRLHREERNAKNLARYHSDPKVIARREARAAEKVEREARKAAEREARAAEKERKRLERLEVAMRTRRGAKGVLNQ